MFLLHRRRANVAQGTIKKLTDKGFGFIAGDGEEIFFHMSALQDVRYEDLREGQTVEFTIGQGPKGSRAENITVV
jgi:CspA family cold shock protein